VIGSFIPGPRRRGALWIGLIVCAILVVMTVRWLGSWNSPPRPTDAVFVETAVRSVNPGYVGPQACASCHAERVAEFARTRHSLACVAPDAAMMPAGFTSGRGRVPTVESSLHFEMEHAHQEFVQTTVRESESGEERTTSPIAFVYGFGGSTDEVFFTWHGNRLYELPVVWLHPLEEWGTNLFDPQGTGDLSREATIRCVECHTTWFEHTPGTLNEYRAEGAILGVTCERCHGPAAEHVASRAAKRRALPEADVVHPRRLSRDRQIDVCAQCHSNTIKPRGRPFTYVSGKPLEGFFKPFETRYPEDDHVANQVGALRQSRCFAQSESLTCTTCHDPHRVPSPDRLVRSQSGCLNCHEADDCHERNRLPEAVRESCADCHMPISNKVQVNFRAANEEYFPPARRNEHRIAVYPAARDEVLLHWHRSQDGTENLQAAATLEEALAAHWLSSAVALKLEHRFLAAIDACRMSLQFDASEGAQPLLEELISLQRSVDSDWAEAVRLVDAHRNAEAITVLERLLSTKPEHAKAHGKLGMLYAIEGRDDLAREHLERVEKLDPNDAYGVGMLGWLAYLKGDAASALDYYRRADDIEPQNARVQLQMGLAYQKLGILGEAANRFRYLLEIEPQNLDAFDGLASTLRQQGRFSEAIDVAQRAVRITENRNAVALMTLAESWYDFGRLQEAEETSQKVASLIQEDSSDAATRIEARLRVLQNRLARRRK